MSADVVVIGSGPNGLAAAITMARAGHSVVVYEAEQIVGGGARTAELNLSGFHHDICSSVHPMAVASQFFASIPQEDLGLAWIYPPAGLAHPFDDGTAVVLNRSLVESADQFGADKKAVRRLLEPFVKNWSALAEEILRPAHIPKHPWLLYQFGRRGILPAAKLATQTFRTPKARAVFAGMAAHSTMPLTRWGSSSFGIVLWTLCHAVGWPFARGGSQAISNALAEYFRGLGGAIITGKRVESLSDLPEDTVVVCDVTPRQFLLLAGDRISRSEKRKLEGCHYGPAVFKIDWSLDEPIPWNARGCCEAGTVHLGESLEEIVQSEQAAWSACAAQTPFVLVTQPSLFDRTRAPDGRHTAWGYCHVPLRNSENMIERIESQVERFAAGFRKHIIARSVMAPRDLETHNANLIGGDISGGSVDLKRLLLRSTNRSYRTSIDRVFLCSSSMPPGPGVHGLCGYFAAKFASEKCF
jgi:phytoene dehydrogenase-like protein